MQKDILKNSNKETIENEILQKAESGIRISSEEALFLWKHGNFKKMGITAHSIKCKKVKKNIVSYTVFRIINYTNHCIIRCNFCSFTTQTNSDSKEYTLSPDQIIKQFETSYKHDVKQLFLQGGVNPELSFDYYLELLRKVKKEFSDIHIRAFSPVEILHMSKNTGMSLSKIFLELKDAGMDSFPGAGAEILSDRMRNILSNKKASTYDWVLTMKTAHEKNLLSSANIVWGSEETDEEIIDHLAIIRKLQDDSKGILSFVPWTFQQQTKNFKVRYVPTYEYLKMVALCRIFFDNISHIEASLLVHGEKAGELALLWGSDDINSPVIEENVLRSYGLKTIKEAENFIKKAGFKPVRRNFMFEYDKKS
ncbi:MAG: radical SAM protein [Spirochaetia bacterium]|nr:radical SAM protein [Spirochaetia bacterium]